MTKGGSEIFLNEKESLLMVNAIDAELSRNYLKADRAIGRKASGGIRFGKRLNLRGTGADRQVHMQDGQNRNSASVAENQEAYGDNFD